MKTLDEIIGDKILEIAHYILSKFVKPDMTVDKVTQLDKETLDNITLKYRIEGIILDVDETMRKEMKDIPQCNKDWIESLRCKVKIIILSNGKDKKIEQYFQEKGIDYIGFAHKPLKKNFIKACKKMNISPNKVLVVGDSLFNDIYGGKKNNMKTVLVKEVEDNER